MIVDGSRVVNQRSPLLFGNSVIFGGDSMGYNKWVSDEEDYEEARRTWRRYLPEIRDLGPTILRYPGGLVANNFDWKQGIGPIGERNPDYGGPGIPQTFGTDEFLRYAEDVGAEAILVVNVSVAGLRPGTVEAAADWVEYCNAPNDGSNPGGGEDWAALRAANGHPEPYGVAYWELGNEEVYPGWEDYADRVKDYSAAMKAVDPSIQLGVIRSGTGLDANIALADWLDYHDLMLDRAGHAFDFWSHHVHIPSSDGYVKGFSLVKAGASVSAPFRVNEQGDYLLRLPVEGTCGLAGCPCLRVWVDEEPRGVWDLMGGVQILDTEAFPLSRGEHSLRLAAERLPSGRRLSVSHQLVLIDASDASEDLLDLRNGPELYHAILSGWKVPERSIQRGEPHTGGKPVFYTEASTVYTGESGPQPFCRAAALREMLSTGLLYNLFIRTSASLVNYWLLFEDDKGVGVLEGVALDTAAQEQARSDPRLRPVFHLLRLYRRNLLEEVVQTVVQDSPGFSVGAQTGVTIGYAQANHELDYVHAVGSRSPDGTGLSVIITNTHPYDDLAIPIYIEGFEPNGRVEVFRVVGSSVGAANDPEDCPTGDCVRTVQEISTYQGSPFVQVFPRHSVTALRFY